MDQILSDHSAENLAQTFNAVYLYETDDYALIAQKTEIPWLQFIPKRAVDTADFAGKLYGEIHAIAFYLQQKGYGHFNVAKIGNKHPAYHIHLVFREKSDEVWPEAIWCQPIAQGTESAEKLKQDLKDYFS